jgi:hypothetical protein
MCVIKDTRLDGTPRPVAVRSMRRGRLSLTGIAAVSARFPDVVCSLSGLMHLDVFGNSINDTFPTSLYRCGSLYYKYRRDHIDTDS